MSLKAKERAESSIRSFIKFVESANDDFEYTPKFSAHSIYVYMVTAINFSGTDIGVDSEQRARERLDIIIELSSDNFYAYESCIELDELLLESGISIPKKLATWLGPERPKRPHGRGRRTSDRVKHEMLVVACVNIAASYGFSLIHNATSTISATSIASACLYERENENSAPAKVAKIYQRAMNRSKVFNPESEHKI